MKRLELGVSAPVDPWPTDPALRSIPSGEVVAVLAMVNPSLP